jgi:hypothetical protein
MGEKGMSSHIQEIDRPGKIVLALDKTTFWSDFTFGGCNNEMLFIPRSPNRSVDAAGSYPR